MGRDGGKCQRSGGLGREAILSFSPGPAYSRRGDARQLKGKVPGTAWLAHLQTAFCTSCKHAHKNHHHHHTSPKSSLPPSVTILPPPPSAVPTSPRTTHLSRRSRPLLVP